MRFKVLSIEFCDSPSFGVLDVLTIPCYPNWTLTANTLTDIARKWIPVLVYTEKRE